VNDGACKTTLGRERAFRDGAGRARLYPGAWKEIARLAYLFFSWWGTKERRIGESPAGLVSGGRGRRRRGLSFDGLARQAGRREVHGAEMAFLSLPNGDENDTNDSYTMAWHSRRGGAGEFHRATG